MYALDGKKSPLLSDRHDSSSSGGGGDSDADEDETAFNSNNVQSGPSAGAKRRGVIYAVIAGVINGFGVRICLHICMGVDVLVWVCV